MMSAKEIANWLKWLIYSSVPLVRLKSRAELPIGIASACLLNFRGRRFIVTAAHAVPLNSSDWHIDLGPDEKGRRETFHLGPFLYAKDFHRSSGEIRDVDVCCSEIPKSVNPVYQRVTPQGAFSGRIQRAIFDLTTTSDQTELWPYAFSGAVFPEVHGTDIFVTSQINYPGLTLRERTGRELVFALPVPHPGHDSFKGCSGAPIVDRHRKIIGIVSRGCIDTNSIHGIPIACVQYLLDFIVSEFPVPATESQ